MGIPCFRGVFIRDAVPPTPHPIECGILNHNDRYGPGTHWTSWHKDKGSKVYFDPYGLPSFAEMVEYLRPKFRYSLDELQKRGTVQCGHFCLYMLKLLAEVWTFEDEIFSL